jgi:predicted metal-binding protein
VGLLEKYQDMALELGAVNAKLITPDQIFFDRRVILKCRWGCDYDGGAELAKCGSRGISYEDGIKSIQAYGHVLMAHSHDARDLSRIVLEIERRAFLDGLYLALAVRACNLCKKCSAGARGAVCTPKRCVPATRLWA